MKLRGIYFIDVSIFTVRGSVDMQVLKKYIKEDSNIFRVYPNPCCVYTTAMCACVCVCVCSHQLEAKTMDWSGGRGGGG